MIHAAFTPYIYEFGPADGRPLLFFHGFPGSHRQAEILERYTERFHLRVLAVDRPGYGHSAPLAGGDLKDFVLSLERALAARAIDRFYLLGVSGGNPAALSAASHFGRRVIALGSVCGLAPPDTPTENLSQFQRRFFPVAKHMPTFALRLLIERMLRGRGPEERIQRMMAFLDARDREVLSDPEIREMLLGSMELARNHGSAGILFDMKTYTHVWPVDFQRLQCPYFLWHGERDRILSPGMSHDLHSRVAHSRLKLYPNEGHYSLPILRGEEILADLTSDG